MVDSVTILQEIILEVLPNSQKVCINSLVDVRDPNVFSKLNSPNSVISRTVRHLNYSAGSLWVSYPSLLYLGPTCQHEIEIPKLQVQPPPTHSTHSLLSLSLLK